jgi:hypothetical protein
MKWFEPCSGRSSRWRRVVGAAWLFPLALLLGGCPDEPGCKPYPAQCHAGEVWVGEPFCECTMAGDIPETEGPEGSRSTGTVSIVGIAGWEVEQVTARAESIAAAGTDRNGARLRSNGYPVRVTGDKPASLKFSTDVIGGVPFGVLGTAEPALVVRWNGPIRLRLRSPLGVVSVVELDEPESTLPVRVTRVSPTLIRMDGDIVQGVVRLALVGFVGTED